MAWTSTPSFIPSSTLSSAQMNILSDNIEFLHGIVTTVNAPFNAIRTVGESLTESNNGFRLRKSAQYLLWRLELHSGETSNVIEIHIDDESDINNPVEVLNLNVDSGGESTPTVWDGAIDLDSEGISDGDFFKAWIKMTSSNQADFEIAYLFNSDNTTI